MADNQTPGFDHVAARDKRARTASMMVIGGAVATAVSAFLPWVSAGLFTLTGIDGDGQITLVLGAIVIVIWFALLRNRSGKVAAWSTIVCGGLVTAIGVYHYSNLGDVGSIGIGVYGTIAAGVVTAIGGIETLRNPLPLSATPSAAVGVVAPPSTVALPPPGWHPDPHDATSLRYWDGTAWTDQTARREEPRPLDP